MSPRTSTLTLLLFCGAFAQDHRPPQVAQSVLDAARSGDEDAIGRWIRSGANVNTRGPGGTTVLHAAAEGNQPRIVKLLIAAGSDVNVQDGKGVSALLAASLSAGPDVVRRLLESGARLVEVPAQLRASGIADLDDSYTPLLYLIVKGQLDNVRRTVAAGADPAHEINDRSLTMYASEHDWAAIVELLDRAVRPDAAPSGAVRDPFGRGYTPLMVAAAKGEAAEFHRLLGSGADWKGTTRSHATMLMFAAQGGNAAIVDTLLSSGAKGGQRNSAGWTAVMYAAVRGDAVTVEKLLAAGEDPSIPEQDAGALVLRALTPEVRSLLGKRQPSKGSRWDDYIGAGKKAAEMGNYPDAERLFKVALREAEVLSKDDPRVATSLVCLARLYVAWRKCPDAKPLYERALAIRKKALGPKHPDVAECLHGLAVVAQLPGDWQKAESLHREALVIREHALGPEDSAVAESLNYLGIVSELLRKYKEAEEFYQRALSIRTRRLGEEHPDTLTTTEHYARILAKMNREPESARLKSQTAVLRTKHVALLQGDEPSKPAGVPASCGAKTVVNPSRAGLRTPGLVSKVEPEYTEDALLATVEGDVLLSVIVAPTGDVCSVRLIRSAGFGMDEMAAMAVRQWKLEPLRKDGEPVAFTASVSASFFISVPKR